MIFGVEELKLLGWTDVRIRNDPLNELDDISFRGLTIICDKLLKKTDCLNVILNSCTRIILTADRLIKTCSYILIFIAACLLVELCVKIQRVFRHIVPNWYLVL